MSGAVCALMAACAGWSPANFGTALKQWINDASPITGTTNASQVNDLSASGFPFVQATAADQPAIVAAGLNGRRVLRFDGVSDHMRAPSAVGVFQNVAAAMVFGVYNQTVTDGAATQRGFYWFSRNGSTTSRVVLGSGNSTGTANAPYTGGRRLDADAFGGASSTTARSAQWVMAMGLVNFTARTADLWVNGALDASGSTLWTAGGNTSNTASNSVALGAIDSLAGFFQGDVAEVGAYVGTPSAADIDRWFGYAAHRYGLTANLPGGHPYKTAPP